MSRFEDYDDLTVGSLDSDSSYVRDTAEYDETPPTYTFPTDGSSNVAGESMHDLFRAIYNRDDRPEVAGIELVNYNEDGSGWFSVSDRYRTGLRFLVRDGSNGLVEALEIDNKGNLSVAGTIEGISGGSGAPLDGGGTASLTNYASIQADEIHSSHLSTTGQSVPSGVSRTVSVGEAAASPGQFTVEGELTIDGSIQVI